jgi:G-protein coupled receptor 98
MEVKTLTVLAFLPLRILNYDYCPFLCRRVTLTFEPAQTMLQTTVVVLQEDEPEDTETFTVELINPLDGADIGPQSSVAISILSNDNAHGVIEFAAVS